MPGERFLPSLSLTERHSRTTGRTMAIDRLAPVDWEMLPDLAPYITYVKIGWTLPLLLSGKAVEDRVKKFRDSGVKVSNGGTLVETAIRKGRVDAVLESVKRAGFNVLELSEGVIDVSMPMKKRIAEFAHSNAMSLTVEVGKKNPRNQLSLDETVNRVNESMDLEPDNIIIEGRESGRSVEIYDDLGDIKWDWVRRIVDQCPRDMIMFEAPQERQQIELVIRLGPDVNLGNVSLGSVAALETQRRGLRGDTFGIVDNTVKVRGPPSSKFVYYIIANHGPLDQSSIMSLSGLNRKTVQFALAELVESGIIRAGTDRGDLRKKVYSVNSGIQ